VELFGTEYLPLFGMAAVISFMLSGHTSLYHSQRFAQPKLGREKENWMEPFHHGAHGPKTHTDI